MSALGAPRVNHAFPSPPFLIREATLLSVTRAYRWGHQCNVVSKVRTRPFISISAGCFPQAATSYQALHPRGDTSKKRGLRRPRTISLSLCEEQSGALWEETTQLSPAFG